MCCIAQTECINLRSFGPHLTLNDKGENSVPDDLEIKHHLG